jgi:hypothetical protein
MDYYRRLGLNAESSLGQAPPPPGGADWTVAPAPDDSFWTYMLMAGIGLLLVADLFSSGGDEPRSPREIRRDSKPTGYVIRSKKTGKIVQKEIRDPVTGATGWVRVGRRSP